MSRRCPICRSVLPLAEESPERGPKWAPLCSSRCKRIDLDRSARLAGPTQLCRVRSADDSGRDLATWLGEGYRIEGAPAESTYDDGGPTGDER